MNLLPSFLRKRFARAAARFLARYEGAYWSPTRSYIPAAYQSVRFDADAYSRSELARKMRYFERNNPLVQALAGKFENFVVGANPQIIASSSDPVWNEAAQEVWDGWVPYCDLTSRQPFGTLLNLIGRRWFIDGEIFAVKTKGADFRGNRPRLQLIEGHLCRTPKEYVEDPQVHDGVRFDKNGRAVLYYFAKEEVRGEYVFGPPTPAESVIHVFEPERPGELRGISFFHACLNELHDLDDLSMLEMQAARENASTTDWIETASGELEASTMIRNRMNAPSQLSNGTVVQQEKVDYYRDISGGRTRVMMRGDKVHQHAGERPSVTTVDYWRLKKELVCAAVEIPYCIVFPGEVGQGTEYRGALDMATAAFKSRHGVIRTAAENVWEYVIGEEIKGGNKRLQDNLPKDWRKISMMPPRAPNVDVGRNATAEKDALADGRTNYDLIYGPLGLSWKIELKKFDQQLAFIENDCPNLFRMLAAQNAPQQALPAPVAADAQYQID